MGKEFTQPARGPGGPSLKAPPTVPLSQAPKDKQEAYGALAAAREAEVGDVPENKLDIDGGPEPGPVEPYDEEDKTPEKETEPVFEPSDSDKKSFLSALLGDKIYEKKFALYGQIQATFRDRSVNETEMIFDVLNTHHRGEDYDLWYERFLLAVQLKKVNEKEYDGFTFAELRSSVDDAGSQLAGRVANFMKMPRPIYQGLMGALRRFEGENKFMTEHALDADFWAPGGPA